MVLYCIALLYTDKLCTTTYLSNLLGTAYCTLFSDGSGCCGICTTMFLFVKVFGCPCMAIDVSVQYNGGLLHDIKLLTQCYYHRGTRFNAMMKKFCICSLL